MNLHIFRLLSIVYLTPKVFHARNRLIIGCHLQDWKEEAILFFTLQRRPHSNYDFEIVLIRGALARLEGVGGDVCATCARAAGGAAIRHGRGGAPRRKLIAALIIRRRFLLAHIGTRTSHFKLLAAIDTL